MSLDGEVDAPREQVELLTRPGVPGIAILRQGRRGRPFQLRSFVDAPDLATARNYYVQYAALIGEAPVEIVKAGLSLSGEAFYVQVLDVRPLLIAPLLMAVGGLNPPSAASIECQWDLVGVELVETE